VQDRLVTDGDLLADVRPLVDLEVDDGAVLDVRSRTDDDLFDVRTQHHTKYSLLRRSLPPR